MKRILGILTVLLVACMWPCRLVVADKIITIESKLEITTFQSDFVFINWYLSVNLAKPALRMKMLVPGNVLENNVTLPVMISFIDKIVDSQTNRTTFSIEGPLPLGTISDDFPHDRYEANYFIGCNSSLSDSPLELGGNIPGPTDNYQGQWSLQTDPEISNKTAHLPPGLLEGYNYWFRLRVAIFHRPPFQEYVDILAKQVPFWLQVFGWLMAISMFMPIVYDCIVNRSRKSRRLVLVERVVIPICIAMIVFVPVYILALHEFEAPLVIPRVEQSLVNILYLYLGIILVGILFRVILRGNDLEPRKKIQKEPKRDSREQSSQEAIKDTGNSMSTSEMLSLRSDLREDIRNLDNLNFTIIATISTISLGIITAGTAIKNSDLLIFFFAGIAIVNCVAIAMLLRNRISVLEKTWYVYYLESKLPSEDRRFSPFGFSVFSEPLPERSTYRYMLLVHEILIILGFTWALAALYSFVGASQHIFAYAILFVAQLSGYTGTDIQPFLAYDYMIYLGVLIFFFLFAIYVLKARIHRGFKERWDKAIWVRDAQKLRAIESKFLLADEEREPSPTKD